MISLRICIPIALSVIAGGALQAATHPTIRIVASLHKYNQPVGLIEGSPGVFYAMTAADAFSVTSTGVISVLAAFPSSENIISTLVSGPDNRFYSAVENSSNPAHIFSVTSSPDTKAIHSAQDFAPDFYQNLPDGTFLGSAGWNGDSYVVTADVNGTIAPIYHFPSGDRLFGNVLYATDGNYYGVPLQQPGSGYVFRLTPSGSLTKLYAFPSNTFNGNFTNTLLQASDGNFYGTTPTGGPQQTGTIYRLTPGGQYTLLYTFANDQNGGPTTLIEASDGNLYGTTLGAVTNGGFSQLFRITKSGQFTQISLLKSAACYCGMVQGSDGIIYATAVAGGTSGAGEIFALDAGLPKPRPWAAQFSPQSGAAGTPVRIWGRNLLSASVEFNGVPATNVYSSGSNYVWATVPAGASSGPITVTTPGGTITTQASFAVQ
jgi:uncharacterized repeat protein (TIGR03803 family)